MKLAYATLLLALSMIGYAQQDQQTVPPLPNQSSYPKETHKMSPAETANTPSHNGHLVDLNTGSKKDLAALPGVRPDFAQTIIDGRPYHSKHDLLQKKVIPQATYDQIQNMITAAGPKKQSLPENH